MGSLYNCGIIEVAQGSLFYFQNTILLIVSALTRLLPREAMTPVCGPATAVREHVHCDGHLPRAYPSFRPKAVREERRSFFVATCSRRVSPQAREHYRGRLFLCCLWLDDHSVTVPAQRASSR